MQFTAQSRIKVRKAAGIHGTLDVFIPILQLEWIQPVGPVPAVHLLFGIVKMPVDLCKTNDILFAVGILLDLFFQKFFRFLPVL